MFNTLDVAYFCSSCNNVFDDWFNHAVCFGHPVVGVSQESHIAFWDPATQPTMLTIQAHQCWKGSPNPTKVDIVAYMNISEEKQWTADFEELTLMPQQGNWILSKGQEIENV